MKWKKNCCLFERLYRIQRNGVFFLRSEVGISRQQPPFGAKNIVEYLSADTICSQKQTVFREEQITSKDKFPNIISPNEAHCVCYPSNLFSQSAQFWKVGNIWSGDLFIPIAPERKYFWWIIMAILIPYKLST